MNTIELIKQLAVAVPVIMAATQTLTAALKGIFTVQNPNVSHVISWVISVLCGLGFVLFNGLDFGLPVAWNYVLGAVSGLICGGAANGVYDWPAVKKLFDAITSIFGEK